MDINGPERSLAGRGEVGMTDCRGLFDSIRFAFGL